MNGLGNRILLSVLCLFLLCGARADEKEEAFGADIVFKNPQRRWMPQEDLIALLKELSYTKFSRYCMVIPSFPFIYPFCFDKFFIVKYLIKIICYFVNLYYDASILLQFSKARRLESKSNLLIR